MVEGGWGECSTEDCAVIGDRSFHLSSRLQGEGAEEERLEGTGGSEGGLLRGVGGGVRRTGMFSSRVGSPAAVVLWRREWSAGIGGVDPLRVDRAVGVGADTILVASS
eukprot:743789-Prorocentrum_minimum.AAC.1